MNERSRGPAAGERGREGLPITYGGAAILPHAEAARWVERR